MATQINNVASATYGYGRDSQASAVSNIATTSLIEDYAISGTKTPLKQEFRPGENITYQIYVRNDGTEPLYNVTISDDLGGVGSPLSYILGTASLNIDGSNSPIIPTSVNPLTFVLPSPFDAGSQATVTFIMRVSAGLDSTVESITNTASVTANEGSASGAVISITPALTSTITLEDFALLTINKAVSADEISPNEIFSYTISLENTGNLDANGVVVTDVLPSGFTVNSITALTNGVITTYNAGEYSVDVTTNTLTLPVGAGPEITVPAATSTETGLTVITVTGSIS